MEKATQIVIVVLILVFKVPSALAEPPVRTDFLALWQKPGNDQFSCSSCHTPSGREILDSNISLEDVKRRALNHLSTGDATAIAQAVGEERKLHSFPISGLRPFQPEGKALAGSTIAERDTAFGQSLQTVAPHLAGGEVWTVEEAEKAARELLATPLRKVQPGIVFDPLSRDPVRALDGPALGDWIPDVGLSRPGTKAFEEACRKYRRPDGSYDLAAIDAAVTVVEGRPTSPLSELARLKRLALLEYVSLLETGHPPRPVTPGPHLPEDPIWAVGNFARKIQGATAEAWGMNATLAARAGVPMGKPIDMRQTALSWFWVGWTIDPSLQSTSFDRKTRTGQYLAQMFWDAGPYPWHAAYFAARRPLEEREIAASGIAFQPEINAFVNGAVLERNLHLEVEAQQAFVRWCANLLRMDCLLIQKDRREGRKVPYPFSARQQLSDLWHFVGSRLDEPSRQKTQQIVDTTVTSLTP